MIVKPKDWPQQNSMFSVSFLMIDPWPSHCNFSVPMVSSSEDNVASPRHSTEPRPFTIIDELYSY